MESNANEQIGCTFYSAPVHHPQVPYNITQKKHLTSEIKTSYIKTPILFFNDNPYKTLDMARNKNYFCPKIL